MPLPILFLPLLIPERIIFKAIMLIMNPAKVWRPAVNMLYREYERIERIKHWLKVIAYASLALDFAIAFATLASLNLFRTSLPPQVLMYLNYALTAEVAITGILFASLAFLMHYQKVLNPIMTAQKKVHRTIKFSGRR